MDFEKKLSDAFYNIANNAEISAKCPNCNADVKVTLNDNGSTVKCPNCESDIKVEVNYS